MTGGLVYGDGFAVVPDAVIFAEVSSNAKVLWAILQRHADPHGRCYPGRRRMAELMGVSEDTIKRVKKELVDAELLCAAERFDEHGRRTTDNLILHHARCKDAPTGGCKDAPTYIDAVELEPEELDPQTPTAPRRPPTDTRPLFVSDLPEATPADRARALEWVRAIRNGAVPE